MRSRTKKTRRIRIGASRPALWPANRGSISPRPGTIHQPPRERTTSTYVPDLVCPPTSVITFASVTTLRRCLRRNLRSIRYKERARNSLAAPFIDSPPPMYLMICREYDLISKIVTTSGIARLLGLLSPSVSVTHREQLSEQHSG